LKTTIQEEELESKSSCYIVKLMVAHLEQLDQFDPNQWGSEEDDDEDDDEQPFKKKQKK
jgi:chaperone required for assembly of F1-ATPase